MIYLSHTVSLQLYSSEIQFLLFSIVSISFSPPVTIRRLKDAHN